jgi:hypothetical protein
MGHAFAGDDWRAVLRDLEARGLVDREGRLTGRGGRAPAAPPALAPRARARAARALWGETRPLAGALAAQMLLRRGITRPPGPDLRFHPAVPAAVYAGRGRPRPALLAAVRDGAGAVTAVEVRYLAPDGAPATVATPRKTIGVLPPEAAVRLDAPGSRLLVGEGVFTCLSAAERFGWPAWALLSAARLARWRPPPGLRAVLVAADPDPAGRSAAAALAGRLRAMGLRCAVRWPPPPFADWNDARNWPDGAAG